MLDNIYFVKSVYSLDELPKKHLPEIVLCGRSNVGKSTFINSILNKKKLAKTSSTPGKTQSLNYYSVDDKFYFVDLPGYGYAKVSIKERVKWKLLIRNFLSTSENVSIAFHLIDSRHKPTKNDLEINSLLTELRIPYLFILTKADKLNNLEKKNVFQQFVKIFPQAKLNENTILYSAFSNEGKKEIISLIFNYFYI